MLKRIFYTLWKLVVAGAVLLFIASHFSTVIHDFSTRYITHPVRGFYAAVCNTVSIPVFEIGAVLLVLAIPFLIWRYVSGFGRITPLLLALEIIVFGYLVTVGIDGAIPVKSDEQTLYESNCVSALENITREIDALDGDLPENIEFPESEIRSLAAAYAYGRLDSHLTHIPKIKTTIFDGMIKGLGVCAYYAPVTAEVILRGDLSDTQKISASMHELMHFVGVSEEDVAIYHSVAAALESKNTSVRYSALLEAYVHVGAALYEINPEKYLEISSNIPPRVTKDLEMRQKNAHNSEIGDVLNDAAISLRDGRGGKSYKNAAAYLVRLFEKDTISQ